MVPSMLRAVGSVAASFRESLRIAGNKSLAVGGVLAGDTMSTSDLRIRTVFDAEDLAALREKSAAVLLPLTPDTQLIIQSMLTVMQAKMPAAGLAAPQIGFKQQIILCTFTRKFEDIAVMINPQYEPQGDERVLGWEGCFSAPRAVASVARWQKIRASYWTPAEEQVEQVLEGKSARIFQHECGHLKGELTFDIAAEFKTFEREQDYQAFLQILRTADAQSNAPQSPKPQH